MCAELERLLALGMRPEQPIGVARHNRQVNLLRGELSEAVRARTVDKLQGQEADVQRAEAG